MAALSGCTINVYHVSTPELAKTDNSLLVVPDTPIELGEKQAKAQSAPSTSTIISNSDETESQTTGTTNSVLSMRVEGSGDKQSVSYKDTVGLEVRSSVDAYLNCFHKESDGAIVKVFPNRYNKRYWVNASQQLNLPDAQNFQFLASSAGATEGFMCLLSSEDVLSKLPGVYQAHVFQKLPVKNFDAVFALYRQATKKNLVGRVVTYQIQE